MRAQIFSLATERQKTLCHEIENSLRENFYQKIEVEHRVYDDDEAGNNKFDIGKSYLELLKASTISVGDFTLEVESKERNWGYWGYWGYAGKYFLRLFDRDKTKVFPSVAIMDHMVMVPQGIHDAFDKPSDFSYLLKPLDLRGVLLVDFDDEKAIREAVIRIGNQIKTEITSLSRRYMSVKRVPTPDLVDLGKLLDVHEGFLRGLEQTIVKPFPHLIPRVISEPVRLQRRSQVTLEIRNESEDALGVVRAQVRAPSTVMRAPLAQYLDFSSRAKCQHIQFDVVPRITPYCPLEVLFLFDETAQASTFPIPLILDVIGN